MSMSPEMTPCPSPPDPTTPSESPPTTPLYTSPPAPTTPSPPAPYTPLTRPSSFPPSTPTPSTPAPTTPVYSSPPAPTARAPTATPSPPAPPTPSTSPSSSPPSTPTPSTPSTPSGNSPTPPPTRTGTTRSLPPPPSSSGSPSTPSSGSSSRSSNLSTGLVVGIAIAGVVTLLALSLLFIWWKKKKRRRRHEEDYCLPPPSPPPGPKSGVYGGQQYNGQQNPPSRADNVTYPEPSPPPVPSRPLLSSGYSSTTSNSTPPFMSSSGSGFYYSVGEILPPPLSEIALGSSKSTFTYEELARATEGFSEANLLGQGGFGYVYKGILPNGKEVAVKHLKAGSGQGEREFHAEVEIISRVHHKHLVSLVGYCIAGTQRMLVYEFVPNNTLEFHLHGKGQPTMDWPTRMKIALGSAKGLAYLHEDCHPKIIHRDIKAANILLDFKFEAKVADFGLAKFFPDVNTHVSTRVMGTFGYLAPEYASSGKLTDKSDVFSFGVMLLELITGRRPIDSSSRDDSLVDWARPLLTRALDDNNFDNLADPRLQNEYNHNEMARMVACAAACVRHSARRRPRISQIVRALEGDVSLSDLNEGITPRHSNIHDYGSSDYNTSQYNEDMKKFRKMD